MPTPVNFPQPSTRNITWLWRQTTEAEREHGIEWYARARRFAEELDPQRPGHGAGATAAASPQLSWPLNCDLVVLIYLIIKDGGTPDDCVRECGFLSANVRKAARIAAGEDPDKVLGGPKVRAFWQTIADPSLPGAVVIDRHAFDIAVGRVTDDPTRQRGLGTPKRYAAVAELYRRAARIISKEEGRIILPSQVQATTWAHWRTNYAVADHGDVAA